MKKTIRVACLGDSLTNGRVSYNWIKQLSGELKGIRFYNFGKDGDLAFNALQRIDEVVAVQPDYIFVLLGANDVNGSMDSPAALEYYRKNKNLPQDPTLAWYVECMKEIIDQLKTQTKAKITIISIPILGENLNHEANKKVIEYNVALQNLCKENNIGYIDFHVKQVEYLLKYPPANPQSLPIEFSIIKKAILRRFLLRQGWDTIGKKYGLSLTTDTIHLNETSGKMLAEVVKKLILSKNPSISGEIL